MANIMTHTNSSVLRRLLIVVFLLCILIGPNFGPLPALLQRQMAIDPSVLTLLMSFIIGFSLIILVALRLDGKALHEIGSWLAEVGLGKPTRPLATIVGAFVGLAWGGLILMSTLQFEPEADLLAISLFRVLTALLAAGGATLEDIIGRGYLMNRLNQINIPGWGQVLASALIFAFYHTIWSFDISAFIASLVYGLLLAGLFLWGKRSLTPVILGHAVAVLIGEPFATKLIFLASAL